MKFCTRCILGIIIMIKYKWKVRSIIICFVLLSIIIYALDFALPKSVTSAIHLDATDIYLCSVIINRKTGGSTDFKGKILEEFLEILEATEVRYLTTDLSIDTSLNATNYVLYLNSEERQSVYLSLVMDTWTITGGDTRFSRQRMEVTLA